MQDVLRTIFEWLFRSQPATFRSDYSLNGSMDRLRGITSDYWSAPWRRSSNMVGSVEAGWVNLQRVRLFVGNRMNPHFVGHLRETENGVVLKGRFTLGGGIKVIIGLSLVVEFLFFIGFIHSARLPTDWWVPGIFLGVIILKVVRLRVKPWFPRSDVSWLSKTITSALTCSAAASRSYLSIVATDEGDAM